MVVESLICIVYTDSDKGSDKDTWHSTSDCVVLITGGLVDRLSKLQTIGTMSLVKAKYVACFLRCWTLCGFASS